MRPTQGLGKGQCQGQVGIRLRVGVRFRAGVRGHICLGKGWAQVLCPWVKVKGLEE